MKLFAQSEGRRAFFRKLAKGAFFGGLLGQGYAMLRALVPNVLYEEPARFKVGPPAGFTEGATFLEARRLFIFREQNTFHAVSANCTHLGCTVKMVALNQPRTVTSGGKPVTETHEFHCPCHGSKYRGDGTNYEGPAPKPLAAFRLAVSPEDGQLVVDLSDSVPRDFRLTV